MVVTGRIDARHEGNPCDPPEFDAGIYKVLDGGSSLVGILWVTNSGDPLKATDYWGLSTGYVWPSSQNTPVTYTYSYTTGYNITDESSFKSTCDSVFGSGNTTYVKAVTDTF